MGNSITFGNVNSSTYGLLISGEGVFNAPPRDVEVISIPGRNGDLILDHDRFENIEVTYRAYSYKSTLEQFRNNLSAFRNALASQKGYQRLTDTFHPDEYRLGAFVSGIEINPIMYNTAMGCDIVFSCKPQRFLTSGETEITVNDGATITNPTQFGAYPLLMVNGYGTINLNDEPVVVDPSQPIGDLVLAPQIQGISQTFDTSALNSGDTITVKSFVANLFVYSNDPNHPIINIGISSGDGVGFLTDDGGAVFTIEKENQSFVKGTSATKNFSLTISATTDSTALTDKTIQASLRYDGANTITLIFDKVTWGGPYYTINSSQRPESQTIGEIVGTSTKQTAGDPAYIDLEIGEAYKIDNGAYISLNKSTSIPAELPTLKSGGNTITYSNTITALKIVPRWWKI